MVKWFQSTLPHGERQHPALVDTGSYSFNPRSRTGSDASIRPPKSSICRFNPRSRTGSDGADIAASEGQYLFQSTLPHGERLGWLILSPPPCLFQSTLPHGERPVNFPSLSGMYRFNPRSRTGSDQQPTPSLHKASQFQSTLPHGERPVSLIAESNHLEFQSTLPHGERLDTASVSTAALVVSIHAPARGATCHFRNP